MKTCKHPVRKAFAALLAVLTAAQCAATAFAADPQNRYAGTVLAAINTDYTPSKETKTFDARFPDDDVEGAKEQPAAASANTKQMWDLLWDQIEPMTPEEAAEAEKAEKDEVEAQSALRPYRVGDTKRIPGYPSFDDDEEEEEKTSLLENLQELAEMLKRKTIEVTCVYTDDICTIWTEDVDAWPQEKIRQLGAYAAEKIPEVEAVFGSNKIDTDHDGKFAIVIQSLPDTEYSSLLGYHTEMDLMDAFGRIGKVWMKSAYWIYRAFGAKMDCLHLNIACDEEDIKTVFVHEYQHYIHGSYLFYGKTNRTYLEEDEMYINEGFSTAAEMMLEMPDEWLQTYCDDFNYGARFGKYYSLFDWDTDDATLYGLVFPFFQYIRTRYAALTGDTSADFPGKGIYKRVLESRDRSNQDNTLGIIADILYPSDQYPSLGDTDARCRQLIADFWLAVFYKNPQGEHGFNGEPWAENLSVALFWYNSYSAEIRDGMAAFYSINDGKKGSVTVTGADEGLRLIAIDTDSFGVTYDYNDGTGQTQNEYSIDASYMIYQRPNRYGYNLAGWARTADAEYAEYRNGDTVTLTGDDVFYAVWTPWEVLETDAACSVSLQNYDEVDFFYTPDADGVYYVDSSTALRAEFFDPIEWDDTYANTFDGVWLNGGTTYQVSVYARENDEPVDAVFSIRPRDEYYTLYYWVQDKSSHRDNYYLRNINQYGTEYTVKDCNEQYLGYIFCGWSTEPGDDTVEYTPGDRIVLPEDMNLFAVWEPYTRLETGVPYTPEEQESAFCFIPEEDAIYRIRVTSADGRDYVFYFEGDYYENQSQSKDYTLYAGSRYYLITYNVSSVCVELVSLTLSYQLTLSVSKKAGGLLYKTLTVTLHGKRTYTLPDYRPVMPGYREFAYWEDAETGERYYPGDIIFLNSDTVLVAQCCNSTMPESGGLASVYWHVLVLYIPVWFRCFAQRIRLFGLAGWR